LPETGVPPDKQNTQYTQTEEKAFGERTADNEDNRKIQSETRRKKKVNATGTWDSQI
jgi:hypothetical protein